MGRVEINLKQGREREEGGGKLSYYTIYGHARPSILLLMWREEGWWRTVEGEERGMARIQSRQSPL